MTSIVVHKQPPKSRWDNSRPERPVLGVSVVAIKDSAKALEDGAGDFDDALILGYVRYSTPGQGSGHTVQSQRHIISDFCHSVGVNLAEFVEDLGTSGARSDRQGIGRLERLARKHDGRTIVVAATASRVGREHQAWDEIDARFKENGIELVFADLGFVSEHEKRAAMHNAVGNYHDTVMLMRDGKQTAIRSGFWMFGGVYGYDLKDTVLFKWEDKEGVKTPTNVVFSIFTDAAAGVSPGNIARRLNFEGILPPGKPKDDNPNVWTYDKVKALIRRTTYKGEVSQSVRIYPWEIDKLPAGAKFGGSREIIVYNEALRIVDDETWGKAQPAGKTGTNYGPPDLYLLSYKVPCPDCGLFCTSMSRRGQCHLRCKKSRNSGVECSEFTLDMNLMEGLVWQTMTELLGTEATTAYSIEYRRRLVDLHRRKQSERAEIVAEYEDLKQTNSSDAKVKKFQSEASRQDWNERLASNDRQLLDLEKTLGKIPDLKDVETFVTTHMTSLGDAVARLRQRSPFRPKSAIDHELLDLVREKIETVTIVPRAGGRFDVSIVPSVEKGLPMTPRVFENCVVTASVQRAEDAADRARQCIAAGDTGLKPELLEAVGHLPGYEAEFRDRVDAFQAIYVAVTSGSKLKTVAAALGIPHVRLNRLRAYWRSAEGVTLRKKLAELGDRPFQPDDITQVKRSGRPTLRQRLVADKHPILQHPLTHPDAPDTGISDSQWTALVDAGLAFRDGSLRCSGRLSGRRYLDAVFYMIRKSLLFTEVPKAIGSEPRIRRIAKEIDEDDFMPDLTLALLGEHGILPLPDRSEIPPLRNRGTRSLAGRNARIRASYDPMRVKPGRLPHIDTRRSVRAAMEDAGKRQ